MIEIKADVAILGSGFGGSVTALLLERVGLRPVLIDRASHPRFAIGESSTPIANFVLRELARRYALPRLEPLAKYGTWQAAYPHVVCGLKRGFSYFHHRAGRPFAPTAEHANELLVAASSDDAYSDMHWLRSDVDHFLVREVAAAGIPYLDRTAMAINGAASWRVGELVSKKEAHSLTSPLADMPAWQLVGTRLGEPVRIDATFLIDATGEAAVVARALGIPSRPAALATNSRTIFGHFVGVRPWHDVLRTSGGRVNDHPFYCDHAALHHILEEGWMWQLRFNNGLTSAGFVLDAARFPLDPGVTPQEEWDHLLARYPSIAAQFACARCLQPPEGPRRIGRLQRRIEPLVGAGWALLPHTAGFIDPLHSTGIALNLCGIDRLVAALAEHWGRQSLADALRQYQQAVLAEIDLVDKLVSGCYAARGNFRLFTAFAMLYFAAATSDERRRAATFASGREDSPQRAPKTQREKKELDPADSRTLRSQRLSAPSALPATPAVNSAGGFLCADDGEFRRVINAAWDALHGLVGGRMPSDVEIARFEDVVASGIRPFNAVGLCDPKAHNMYRHTAAPL